MMRIFFIMLSLVLFLTSCSATTGNMKIGTSQAEIESQMAELATKNDVREKFGTPNLIFYKNNQEYYEYKYVTGHGRYQWLIPVLGWMMSLFQDNYTYTETNLFIGFNKTGEIENWNTVKTSGTFN